MTTEIEAPGAEVEALNCESVTPAKVGVLIISFISFGLIRWNLL
jgi:hypothetical protein